MRRSLTLPLEHVSKSYRHKCVHVAHLGALNIRKNTSRQPVERHIRLTSSQSPTFSIFALFKIHSLEIPNRLPSSRCIENAPALDRQAFPDILLAGSFPIQH